MIGREPSAEPRRLNAAALPGLGRDIAIPRYDVQSVVPTVVHFGPGVFHRAHQAVYSDTVLSSGARSGGIRAVSLRSGELRERLSRQDYLYSLVERDNAGDRIRVIGSIREALHAPSDPEAVLRAMADPHIGVVTITVTEKGYCAVGGTGALDTSRTEIVHDIASPRAPRSLPGFLVEALARRRVAGVAPFTVVSCDNVPANGPATRAVVTELAAYRGDDLATWITDVGAFPSSMVDRMAPAATDAAHDLVLGVANYDDSSPVVTEPFSQWVLEDAFSAGRPPWEVSGVEIVTDVKPYEDAKLRILNGAHSALAYFGLLSGCAGIADAAADPLLRRAVADMLHTEVIPTLAAPAGMDLRTYGGHVIERFRNRALGYTTGKVAGDGSQKLPGRILGTVRDQLAAGGPVNHLAAVVAAYGACVFGPRALEFGVDDPALTMLLGHARAPSGDSQASIDTLLGIGPIFGDLSNDQTFRREVHRWAALLWTTDPRAALAPGRGKRDP